MSRATISDDEVAVAPQRLRLLDEEQALALAVVDGGTGGAAGHGRQCSRVRSWAASLDTRGPRARSCPRNGPHERLLDSLGRRRGKRARGRVAPGRRGRPRQPEARRRARDAALPLGDLQRGRPRVERAFFAPAINLFRRALTKIFWWYGLPQWGQVSEYQHAVSNVIDILLADQRALRDARRGAREEAGDAREPRTGAALDGRAPASRDLAIPLGAADRLREHLGGARPRSPRAGRGPRVPARRPGPGTATSRTPSSTPSRSGLLTRTHRR